MSTIETEQQTGKKVPPLKEGDLLSQEEFHDRYLLMPHIKKAELIEGKVYMPSPVNAEYHGIPQSDLTGWLWMYYKKTPYVQGCSNSSVILDGENEVQPDLFLVIRSEAGGRAKLNDEGYVEGAPELAIEISNTSTKIDLGVKKRVYQRNRVMEYLVWQIQEQEVQWFRLEKGKYVRLPEKKGIIKSEVFPGLWLNVSALLEKDMEELEETLKKGMKSKAYKSFVKELTEATEES